MIHRWIGAGSRRIRGKYSASESRMLHLAGTTGMCCTLLGLGKIISGLLSFSVFVCVNGLYTLGMAAARHCVLAGAIRETRRRKQYGYYRMAGIILILSSLLYIAYSIWSVFHPKPVYFGEILAITIAAITFTEIGINLYGVLKYRRNHSLFPHAMKIISLASSLISLVLTQSAILAFTDNTANPAVNGFLGTLMGISAVCLGVYMIRRIRRIEKKNGGKR